MKKLICACLAVLLLCGAMTPVLAEEKGNVIRVTGNATVSLAADIATLQVGVNTRKLTVQEAQEENARLMAAVIEAIRGAGVAEKDIITSQFNVYSNYDYSVDAQGKEVRTTYYEVQNMVSVVARDLNQIGTVLDAAMQAGANTTYGITFSSTEENAAYQKALTRAVEDAAQKAQVLAAAAGKTVGELKLIDASQGNYHYGISNVYSAKGEARDAGTPIVTGDVSVSATVVMEYTFD